MLSACMLLAAQVLVCLAACVAMSACAVFPERFDVVFGSFLLLELSVGVSYAAYATLRARVIPEGQRCGSRLFEPFHATNDHFTKTGSGQT
jgi:hypothetical protein